MLIGDVCGYRQTQSRAVLLGRKEWIEDPFAIFIGNRFPLVADLDTKSVGFKEASDHNRAFSDRCFDGI